MAGLAYGHVVVVRVFFCVTEQQAIKYDFLCFLSFAKVVGVNQKNVTNKRSCMQRKNKLSFLGTYTQTNYSFHDYHIFHIFHDH